MYRLTSSLLALGLFVGCSHPPLQYEENLPQLEDAFPDREQVVFGSSRMYVGYFDNGFVGVCDVDQDIVGWEEQDIEVSVAGCTTCAEAFTLALLTEEGGDCHSVGDLPTLAIAPFGLLQSIDEEYYDDLLDRGPPEGAEGEPVAFASTNWIPSVGAQDEFTPRMALYAKAQDSGLDFQREFIGQSRFVYGIGGGNYVGWSVDLRLTK